MKRLSRSDSSITVCKQISLGSVVELAREALERSRRAENGGKRRLQVVGDRCEQGRAQPVCLDAALGLVKILDKIHALDGQCRLIDQRVEQAALIRGEKRARLVAVDADDADGTAPGAHGQEQALGAGQRV